MCLLIVFLQSDIYIVGNWHAEAVKEFKEEEGLVLVFKLDLDSSC